MNSTWARWFSILRPKVHEFADTFVATRSQLNQNMVHWLPDSSRAPVTLLLAHYPSTFEQLQSSLDENRVHYRIHVGAIDPPLVNQWFWDRLDQAKQIGDKSRERQEDRGTSLCLGLVGQLSGSAAAPVNASNRRQEPPRLERRGAATRPGSIVGVLVAERHSNRQADDRVRDFCRQLEPSAQLGFFLAFDDPLLSGRIDTAMQTLLEHYGMRRDEPLQSMLLERLVRRIQHRSSRQ